jgi:hypothetical protein
MTAERVLLILARQKTRRSFLGRLGKVTVAAAGISTFPLGIALMTPEAANATNAVCGWDLMCGIWGQPCANCGVYYQCPTGSYLGSGSWYWCCSGHVYSYQDCCTWNVPYTCTSEPCHNNPNGQQPTWCPTDGYTYYYYCSIVVDTGQIC